MDRFSLARELCTSPHIDRAAFILDRCRGKRVLDLGCVRHNAEFALKDSAWQHRKIREVGASVVGVDYLEEEVKKLNDAGFPIVLGDVTRPLPLEGPFDVILAGDLIEHLNNFEGFFANCSRLLASSGELILTTPNPFFFGQVFFVGWKRHYIVNPEHTCWLDPQTLSQLAHRFGFGIESAQFISRRWDLAQLILESRERRYDIHMDRWSDASLRFRILRKVTGILFASFFKPLIVLLGLNGNLTGSSDYLMVLRKS